MTGTWLFRVASRPEVGGGHVGRCRTLALAMRPHSEVLFVLDRGGDAWIGRLAEWCLPAVVVGAEGGGPWAGCVLDGYDFGEADIGEWRARAPRVVVIVDSDVAPSGADIVVNQSTIEEPPGGGTAAAGPRVLAGPRYALVDPAYAALARSPQPERAESVFASFGLRDSVDATGLCLAALALLAREGYRPRVGVAIGSRAPHLDRLHRQVAELGPGARLFVDLADLTEPLAEHDMAVGSGGVGLLERMAAGVPSVTVVAAENQRRRVAWAAGAGATADAGAVAELDANMLADEIRRLADDVERRRAMAATGRALIDGRGAERVAERLLAAA